jgi:CBS domain-containing protein
MTDNSHSILSDQANEGSRRPGPFGPALALLPKNQNLVTVNHDDTIHDAIGRLIDDNFSQLPVLGPTGNVVGVFTWQSYGKRTRDLREVSNKIKPLDLPVTEAMEEGAFLGPDIYIDTATDWSYLDYVLIGTAQELLGVLTVSDVFGRLNDFAEAFVLLYELEHDVRVLIASVTTRDSLVDLISNTNIGSGERTPTELTEFTFSQYRTLICSKHNWEVFEPVFGRMRELVDTDFKEVTKLRNDVFHFKRTITARDTDRLRRFRKQIRYDIDTYQKRVGKDSNLGKL